MEYLKIIGFCVVLLIPLTLLKRETPEQGILLSLAVVVTVVWRCLQLASPLLRKWEELFFQAGLEGTHIDILLRTVVLSVVSHLCSGLCKDAGAQTLAAAVEFSSGIAVLVIAMPLLEAVLDLLMKYFT